MDNLVLIALCLGLGIVFRRTRLLPEQAPATLNAFVLTVSVPAVALLSLHDLTLKADLVYPIAMAWILFVASCVFFYVVGRSLGWDRKRVGALILTGGLGNTSFVGFPLLLALYGPEALKTGVLTDQPGTFLVLSSLGVVVASMCSDRSASLAGLPMRLLRFPPFTAMLVAIALRPWPYPVALTELLQKLAATLAPLALVSVGMQIGRGLSGVRQNWAPLATGLAFKLLLGPALIWLLYVVILGAHGTDIQITIVQSAMAPMITGAILASEYGLNPSLANLMIGLGIPLSLITVPLLSRLLQSTI